MILLSLTMFGFFIYALIMFILVLGVIILVHEGGHFYFAKKAGILCHEYSLGMGPVIAQKKKGETFYSIRAIPIGGFVSMAGEDTNESLLKEGQEIGLNLATISYKNLFLNPEESDDISDIEAVKDIILSDKIDAQVKGKVVAYNLYSEDGSEMYIDLEIDNSVKRYYVIRDAFYIFSEKQKIQIAPYDRCFESKTKWQRFLTIFAGPMMNFVLGLFIFLIVGLASGVPNTNSNVIGEVNSNYPAANVLMVNDEILSVNGETINNWNEFSSYLDNNQGIETVTLKVKRNNEILTKTLNTVIMSYRLGIANFDEIQLEESDRYKGPGIKITLIYTEDYVVGKAGLKSGDIITKIDNKEINNWKDVLEYFDQNPKLDKVTISFIRDGEEMKPIESSVWTKKSLSQINNGVSSKTAIGVSCKTHFSFFGGIKNAFILFWNSITTVFVTLGALFSNSQITINELSGPVGIFEAVKAYLGTDAITFLSFVGLISVNIGLVNLLPIPALDGGRILFLGIEAVSGKKINKNVETILNNIVFWLVMVLFVYITCKDIIRLF